MINQRHNARGSSSRQAVLKCTVYTDKSSSRATHGEPLAIFIIVSFTTDSIFRRSLQSTNQHMGKVLYCATKGFTPKKTIFRHAELFWSTFLAWNLWLHNKEPFRVSLGSPHLAGRASLRALGTLVFLPIYKSTRFVIPINHKFPGNTASYYYSACRASRQPSALDRVSVRQHALLAALCNLMTDTRSSPGMAWASTQPWPCSGWSAPSHLRCIPPVKTIEPALPSRLALPAHSHTHGQPGCLTSELSILMFEKLGVQLIRVWLNKEATFFSMLFRLNHHTKTVLLYQRNSCAGNTDLSLEGEQQQTNKQTNKQHQSHLSQLHQYGMYLLGRHRGQRSESYPRNRNCLFARRDRRALRGQRPSQPRIAEQWASSWSSAPSWIRMTGNVARTTLASDAGGFVLWGIPRRVTSTRPKLSGKLRMFLFLDTVQENTSEAKLRRLELTNEWTELLKGDFFLGRRNTAETDHSRDDWQLNGLCTCAAG